MNRIPGTVDYECARADGAEKALMEAHKVFAAEIDALAQTIARLRMALEKCANYYVSEPCTVPEGYKLLADEFRRRMAIAHDALESK